MIKKKMLKTNKFVIDVENFSEKLIVKESNMHWNTPPKYIEPIEKFFDGNVALDPCSNEYSMINASTKYSLPDQDGLKSSWNFPTIFVNPPYGSDRERNTSIRNWIAKCAFANRKYNSEVLALIPVAPNTRHWKEYVFPTATAICFLYDSRPKFYLDGVEHKKGAPMACVMVYWGNDVEKFKETFSKYGNVLRTNK
jgi:hypothetical protein